uniref:Uncharacterized protein n=1 Tax=Timema tahoe TaxID=61484 RepID=A0A7R9IS45_9NEOP|nr:unnamed protein product [Timema tahoe]
MFKMEACDISLVKKENIELIKTEPQNEDEFDIFGQSEIKTEDKWADALKVFIGIDSRHHQEAGLGPQHFLDLFH